MRSVEVHVAVTAQHHQIYRFLLYLHPLVKIEQRFSKALGLEGLNRAVSKNGRLQFTGSRRTHRCPCRGDRCTIGQPETQVGQALVGVIQVGDSTDNIDEIKAAKLPGKARTRMDELLGEVSGS